MFHEGNARLFWLDQPRDAFNYIVIFRLVEDGGCKMALKLHCMTLFFSSWLTISNNFASYNFLSVLYILS